MASEIIHSYIKSKSSIDRNRMVYLMLIALIGYIIGGLPILLVFDIPVDPLWGIPFAPLYAIPMVYAILKYDLVDIRIVARKAFLYATTVIAAGLLIILFNYASQMMKEYFPDFPFWIVPLFSSFVTVSLGLLVWKKLRESDLLKYEFISVVTHKFRTPLTHIKWASEVLSNPHTESEEKEQVEYIQSANAKLVELTNLLANVSETEKKAYEYSMGKNDLSKLAEEVLVSVANQFKIKKIALEKDLPHEMTVMCDPGRVKFVIQTLVENALNYSAQGTVIKIRIFPLEDQLVFSVKDQGIGLSREDYSLLFSKFYRGQKATLTDTEGLGIGLYMSKEIIIRHKGKIWAESEGVGKGSAFYFSLPKI